MSARSRDSSLIVATEIGELIGQLNFILQRMNDRLDKLEGLRDEFDSQSGGNFEGGLTAHSMSIHDDSDGTELHSFGGQ